MKRVDIIPLRYPHHPLEAFALCMDEGPKGLFLGITVWQADQSPDTADVGSVKSPLHVTIPCASDLSHPPDMVSGPTVPTLSVVAYPPPQCLCIDCQHPELVASWLEGAPKDADFVPQHRYAAALAKSVRETQRVQELKLIGWAFGTPPPTVPLGRPEFRPPAGTPPPRNPCHVHRDVEAVHCLDCTP